jgi:hypothetical protein
MRGLTLALLIALVAAGGCGRKLRHANPSATIEEEGELRSRIRVAEGADAAQVIDGFYGPEGQSWCWTRKKFSVALAAPAAGTGALVLDLKYAVPDSVFESMKGASVSASVSGAKLSACTLLQPGQGTCQFPMAVSPKPGEPLIVEFEVDRAIPRDTGEERELALIVSEVGLTRR